MVDDIPSILTEGGLSGQTEGLSVVIRNQNGFVFSGDPTLFSDDAVIEQVPIGNGTWEIAGMSASFSLI